MLWAGAKRLPLLAPTGRVAAELAGPGGGETRGIQSPKEASPTVCLRWVIAMAMAGAMPGIAAL